MIPLVDLKAQYSRLSAEIDEAMREVIDRTAFIGGDALRAFESEFAAYCEAAGCVGMGNGTDSLYVALRAVGVRPGDEVITASHTFIATAEAISLTGAKPVFVDVLPDTMLIDPGAAEAAVTSRTRAIVPVHLYGQPCEMDRLLDLARRFDLKVVEDAAQAHGARWKGRRVGAIGDVGSFSFFPGKNLGAYGDAGGAVSNDPSLVRWMRMFANHGRLEKYSHEFEGINSRLDGLQAAILRVKLRDLDESNERRRRIAALYDDALADTGLVLPVVRPEAEPVWHLYVVRTPRRSELQARLKEAGISSGIHYPLPLHLQPAYAHLGLASGTLPETERAAAEVLSLPIYPELPESVVGRVAEALRD